MTPTSYPIQGGDYQRAGAASRALKEQLKRIGADPSAIRRAVIAAYEAEMNVVIHASGGCLKATLDERRLEVEVADEGPGIPDIDLAMKPGYSTAPAAARELGFGAGMGLPNIKKNSDFFAIESAVGRGTCVRFTIHLRPQEARAVGRHSLLLAAAACRQCLKCIHGCPTRALRVRPGGPAILEHLCIDCTACLAACPWGAIAVAGAEAAAEAASADVLVLPPAMPAQFGAGIAPGQVLAALAEMGWREVWVMDAWEAALRAAVLDFARTEAAVRPVISPACPAVVNLIEARFPSLIGSVAPFWSALEAVREELAGRRAAFVVSCPSQRTALESAGFETMLPAVVRAAVAPRVVGAGDRRAAGQVEDSPWRETRLAESGAILRVTGIRHVVNVLEAIENGLMNDAAVIELFVCDEGCLGSPLMNEDPFVARHRLGEAPAASSGPAKAIRRRAPFVGRAGLRLDADMARAIEKLGRIEALRRTLPATDCGLCGSPTCAALAEDIVMGRAAGAVCVRQAGGPT